MKKSLSMFIIFLDLKNIGSVTDHIPCVSMIETFSFHYAVLNKNLNQFFLPFESRNSFSSPGPQEGQGLNVAV